uniref:Serpentine Receptor, class T n=1 Tax=Rhabditophanes sp. KR3021 TaxID=114890 RepID=A0AC35UET0_9BILA
MNIFFEHNNFDSSFVAKYYNCSYLTPEQWEQERSPHVALGLFYLITGLPLHLLYFPVMWVITRPEFFKYPAFKILTFLGIIDFSTSFVSCEITAYLTIIGSVFCADHPTVTYFIGAYGLAGWAASCFTNLILISNRILDMYKPSLSEKLFEGKKTYIWLFFPCVYLVYMYIYTIPIIYSSKAVSWMFNPYYGINQTKFPSADFYHNPVHTFNNISTGVVFIPLNFLLLRKLFIKVNTISERNKTMDALKRTMLVQSAAICIFNMLSALVYVIIANIPLGIWASVLGQIGWEFSHLIMSFVLCFMNPSVNKYILTNMVPLYKVRKDTKSVAAILSTPNVPTKTIV